MSTEPIPDAAAEIKPVRDSLVNLLTVPLPILLALAVAASAATEDVGLGGVRLPRIAGVYVIMMFNGLLMLHIARLITLLRNKILVSADRDASLRALVGDPSFMNPFFSQETPETGIDGVFEKLLYALPRFFVGMMLGFHFLMIFPPAKEISPLFINLAVVACVLHLGNWVALATMFSFALKFIGRIAAGTLFVGYLLGGYCAYRLMMMLGY